MASIALNSSTSIVINSLSPDTSLNSLLKTSSLEIWVPVTTSATRDIRVSTLTGLAEGNTLRSDLGTDAVVDGVAHVFALDDALLKSVASLHDESEAWLAHKALGVEAIESAVFVLHRWDGSTVVE